MARGVRILVTLAIASIAVAAGATPTSARTSDGRDLSARDSLEFQVLDQINALRRSNGLSTLRVSRGLSAAADAHSTAMATRGFFSHTSIDGTDFSKRLQRHYPKGSHGSWSVGENLLWSSPEVDAAEALRMWLNSPGHRRILLTPRWREIGLSAVHANAGPGVFNGAPVTVVTADFGIRR